MHRRTVRISTLLVTWIVTLPALAVGQAIGPARGASGVGQPISAAVAAATLVDQVIGQRFVEDMPDPQAEELRQFKLGLDALMEQRRAAAVDIPVPVVDSRAAADRAPPLSLNFPGMAYTGWFPPDTVGAAGPDHVIEMANSNLTIYSKAGQALSTATLAAWWNDVNPPGAPFDPRIAYDAHAGRWIMLAVAVGNAVQAASYLVSVSRTADPLGSWCNFNLDSTTNGATPSGNWADYPRLGYDSTTGVYLTSNQFTFAGAFQYAKLRVLQKAELYDPSCPAVQWWDFWNLTNANGSTAFSATPVEALDGPGAMEYLVNTESRLAGDEITLWRLDNPSAPLLTRVATLPIGAFAAPPDAAQPGAAPLETNDARILHATYHAGLVATTFTEAHDWGIGGTVAAVRTLTIDTASSSVLLNQRFGAPGQHYFYPAISSDLVGNLALVFNRSSTSEFASIGYTGQGPGDVGWQSSATLKGGEAAYQRLDGVGRNRWGDYSGIGVDPADGSFWIFSEYADGNVANQWGSWIGKVDFPNGCAPDALEPDDALGQATPLAAGVPQAHSLCPAGDEDWASFSLATRSEVVLETSGPEGDTRMWLFDAGLNQVEFDDDGGGLFSRIDRVCGGDSLAAGSYFVKVDEFGDDAPIDSYSLSLSVAACADSPPFGVVDTPIDGVANVSGSLRVTGWALDDVGVTEVEIFRDPVPPEPPGTLIFVGTAVFIEGARPDVAAAFPALPNNTRAGWGFLVLTNMLPGQGNGIFTLHIFARDASGGNTLLGSRTFTANNAGAILPFGTIDAPGQGEVVSGSAYVVFAWALTPQPKTIPVDGSTFTLYVDNQPVGNLTYNNFRLDIATLFPSLNNSNGAIGFFILDTTQFSNGIHTIEAGVSDDQGAANGLGSRFFWIDNGGAGTEP